MNSGRLPCRRDRKGIVIFLVVGIILMMTLLTYGFLISMRNQNLAAAQAGDRLRARQAAFSARELVCYLLEAPLSQRQAAGGLTDNPALFRQIRLQEQSVESSVWETSGFVVADRQANRLGVVDESSKIDLARLLEHDANNPGWGRESLLQLPGMTESMADRILDWIDADDEPREFGAESEFYLESLGRSPRNGIPPSLDELTQIPEITSELIHGQASRESETSNPRSPAVPRDSGEPSTGWSNFLTVHGAERNEDFDGNPRIHLNDSDLYNLHTRLAEAIDVETANFVILARQYGLESTSSGSSSSDSVSLQSASEIPLDFNTPANFEFESPLQIVDAIVRVGQEGESEETSRNRPRVASPFSGTDVGLDDRIEMLMDQTTASSSPVISGRVNILLAPREVLMSVPGIDSELAEQILANRENYRSGSRSCFWLLSSALITMEQMRQLEPWITNRGDVCQFVYGGWPEGTAAPVVFETVLDASSGTTVQRESNRLLETEGAFETLRPSAMEN